MTISLWDHQWDAITQTANHIMQGGKAGLWEIPTGGGKTVSFVTLARELGWPTLVLVHRDELVRQCVATRQPDLPTPRPHPDHLA